MKAYNFITSQSLEKNTERLTFVSEGLIDKLFGKVMVDLTMSV